MTQLFFVPRLKVGEGFGVLGLVIQRGSDKYKGENICVCVVPSPHLHYCFRKERVEDDPKTVK